MRKVAFNIILILVFYSCNENGDVGSTEEEYVMAFKKTVLYHCIDGATNGNFQRFSNENNDLATSIDASVLYISEALNAKKIAQDLAKNIKPIKYEAYEGRLPIFSDCVDFAFSNTIDSIARAKYKVLINSELEYIND